MPIGTTASSLTSKLLPKLTVAGKTLADVLEADDHAEEKDLDLVRATVEKHLTEDKVANENLESSHFNLGLFF